MARFNAAFPVLPGKAEELKAFAQETLNRTDELNACQKRLNLQHESWYLQHTPMGELLLVIMEGENPLQSLANFGASREPFDVWFKDQVIALCGVDLNQPPPGPMPSLIFDWNA